MTPEEFVAKISWEGGIVDAFEYGLRAEDLDDQDSALAIAWAKLEQKFAEFEAYQRDVIQLLPDWEE